MKLVIQSVARADLAGIAANLLKHRPLAAQRIVDRVDATCRSIVDFPLRWPKVGKSRGRLLRRAISGDYLIFYTVDEKAVRVLHILHGARDIVGLLELQPDE